MDLPCLRAGAGVLRQAHYDRHWHCWGFQRPLQALCVFGGGTRGPGPLLIPSAEDRQTSSGELSHQGKAWANRRSFACWSLCVTTQKRAVGVYETD